MKAKILFLALLISTFASAQILPGQKISAMPIHTGDPSTGYVPIVISGQNKRVQANWINKDRIDSLVTAVTVITGGAYVPLTRQLTINGVTQDLSVNRTWTINSMIDPMTTAGDMIIRNASNVTSRVATGTQGQVWVVGASSIPSWTSNVQWSGTWNTLSTIAVASTTLSNSQPMIRYLGGGGVPGVPGTPGTLTLPSMSSIGGIRLIFLKNASAGTVTIQRGSTDQISVNNHGSLATSFTLAAGQSVLMQPFQTGGSAAPSNVWEVFTFGGGSSGGGGNDASALTTGTLDDARLSNTARYQKTPFLKAIKALGSTIVAQSVGVNMDQMPVTTFATTDGTVYWTAVWLDEPKTIAGIKFWMGVAGNFTGDNFNGFGLYSYSEGTLTQLAISANDENIWKGSTGMKTVPFITPYVANAGLYFVAFVRNSSTETTAPTFGIGSSVSTGGMQEGDFTNSAKLNATHTSQTSLPATRLMSAITVTTLRPWIGLYE